MNRFTKDNNRFHKILASLPGFFLSIRLPMKALVFLGILFSAVLPSMAQHDTLYKKTANSPLGILENTKQPSWARNESPFLKEIEGESKKDNRIEFYAYGDLYLGIATGLPEKKSNFLYNHKINQQLRSNLLLIHGSYESKRFHTTVGLMTGDYVRYNLKEEPFWAKPLYEAYLGFLPFKKSKLWLDAGVFTSYIGFETPITTDNALLSRSIVADNSPYYFSGIRGNFRSKDDSFEGAVYLLNGWQRIAWQQENSRPSLGVSLKRNFSKESSLSYGLFYGTTYPDTVRINRLYQQLCGTLSKGKWTHWGSVDLGIEKGYLWGAIQWTSQWHFHESWFLSQRLETFLDPHNRSIRIGASQGSQLGGLALCLEYKINEAFTVRIEPKALFATEAILHGNFWELQGHTSLSFRL